MKRMHGRILSVVLIAVFLAAGALHADTQAENTVKAENVVNTTTDASRVVSPFTGVVGSVQKSVVGVNNYQTVGPARSRGFGIRGQDGFREQLAATGSGVVVYDGYILTNYHVVENASRLSVSVMGEEEEIEATLAVYDAGLDVAVLHAEKLDVPSVELGDSDMLQVGEWAICVGNPLSEELRGTITVGIVSALDRKITSYEKTDRYGLKTTYVNSMIQTDAAINSGNSGGGLFNVLGQLMGIPTMKYSGSNYSGATVEGIGLAIPINSAKPIIQTAIERQLTDEGMNLHADENESGAAASVRLGVTVMTVNGSNNEAVYAGRLPEGVMIAKVEKGSPAEKSGLLINDVIVEADGNVISGAQALSGIISGKQAGDTLSIKVYRADNLDTAESVYDIKGEYMEFEIEMFAF